jgi:hypothetical protein
VAFRAITEDGARGKGAIVLRAAAWIAEVDGERASFEKSRRAKEPYLSAKTERDTGFEPATSSLGKRSKPVTARYASCDFNQLASRGVT